MLKFLKNKVLLYSVSRYFTYGVQFLGSLLIASYLGVYYLGVWGFIMLIIQYATRINFGIANATNAIVAVHKTETEYTQRVIGVAVSMLALLSIAITLFFLGVYFFDIKLGDKYSFIHYAPYVVAITVISHFNLFFSNVFRVYGKLGSIALSQSLIPFALLFVAFFYKGEQLVFALVLAYLFAVVFSFLVFVISSPVSLKPIFDKELFRLIRFKGWYLFIYNASFYLIVLSTRGFISDYYSVDEFGYFTFAFTLASAILLLFDSLSFLVFPKILNRFANQANEQAFALLKMLRNSYITVCHFSMYLGILFYPLLLEFFHKYASTHKIFVIIALTVLVYTNAFGYPDLMIAKSKEKKIAILAFFALLINVGLNIFCLEMFAIPIEFVMLPTMSVYIVYVFFAGKLGRGLIGKDNSFIPTFFDILDIRLMLPFVMAVAITILVEDVTFWYSLPLLLFLILNYKKLISVLNVVKRILTNPNVIDI